MNATSANDEAFLREAIRLAAEHSQQRDGGPFGSVIVSDGTILGRGWNQVSSTNDPTAHAEVMAIRAACRERRDFRLLGCVLYASCEPCPMCLAAGYWARVERIVYAAARQDAAAIGFDDAHLYEELARPVPLRQLSTIQMLRDEAMFVMQQWNKMPDKPRY